MAAADVTVLDMFNEDNSAEGTIYCSGLGSFTTYELGKP
jgi:hypothetical protein